MCVYVYMFFQVLWKDFLQSPWPNTDELCRDPCCLDKAPQSPAASNLSSNGSCLRLVLSRPTGFQFPSAAVRR